MADDDPRAAASSVMMTVALTSFSMLFAAMFLTYAVVRANAPAWPPAGAPSPGLALPSLSTALIAASSLCHLLFERAREAGGARPGLFWWSVLLGLGFLGSQALLWRSLAAGGLPPESGVFGSLLHGLTWTHAAHIVLGLALLLGTAPQARRAAPAGRLAVRNAGLFWHFLGIVWGLIFLGLFVW